jgi:hypothetical protein
VKRRSRFYNPRPLSILVPVKLRHIPDYIILSCLPSHASQCSPTLSCSLTHCLVLTTRLFHPKPTPMHPQSTSKITTHLNLPYLPASHSVVLTSARLVPVYSLNSHTDIPSTRPCFRPQSHSGHAISCCWPCSHYRAHIPSVCDPSIPGMYLLASVRLR